MAYQRPHFAAKPAPSSGRDEDRPVVVVGAGLVGLTLALDLGRRRVPVVVLDEDDTITDGSRAIVFARRSLEIFARLGLGERLAEKGVAWDVGTVFHGDAPLFRNSLLPSPGFEHPPFLNLQQYYLEEWLVEACMETGCVDIRWRHKVVAVVSQESHAVVSVETPDGGYDVRADWLLACDGAGSFVRRTLDLSFVGRIFRDRFLIADIVMDESLPAERKFWFGPSFHPHRSVLLHKQPDNVWRVDFQLGWDADPVEERRPERIEQRLRAMFGDDARFEIVWASIYTFQSRRLERFVHDRIVFVGDSAHQVSPFGGRGGNGGVQDADNLGWKIAAVIAGQASEQLISTYDEERRAAADDNILHSTRSAEFITPKSPGAHALRDAVLLLANRFDFARQMVNSGRLSTPHTLDASPLNFPDSVEVDGALSLGAPAPDAPLWSKGGSDWLLRHVGGEDFSAIFLPRRDRPTAAPPDIAPGIRLVTVSADRPDDNAPPDIFWDRDGLVGERYGLTPGGCMLFRPDQHLAAHLQDVDGEALARARAHALAL